MKQLVMLLAIVLGTSATTGCIIHTHHPRGRGVVVKERRSCGPAHHWDGRRCVHNGKAKGHHKDKRGHGHGHD